MIQIFGTDGQTDEWVHQGGTRRLHVPKSMHHMYAQCALRVLSKFPLEGVDFHCKFINLNASDDKLLKLAQHQHTNGSLILKALHGLTP